MESRRAWGECGGMKGMECYCNVTCAVCEGHTARTCLAFLWMTSSEKPLFSSWRAGEMYAGTADRKARLVLSKVESLGPRVLTTESE